MSAPEEAVVAEEQRTKEEVLADESQIVLAKEQLGQRLIPGVASLATELMKEVIHDHSPEEIPESVKKRGGVFVSKQMAFANLTKEEAELLKFDMTAHRYNQFNSLDPEAVDHNAMDELAQLEAMGDIQITKGRDFTERKASVTQLVGTFRQAMEHREQPSGIMNSIKRRMGR